MRRSLAAAILVVAAAISFAAPVMADTADDIFDEQIIRPSLPAPAAGGQLASPYAFEFTGEDALRLTVHNSKSGVIVGVHYRMHTLDNHTFPSREFMTPTSDRVASSAEFVLPRGYLQNVTVFATSGAPARGQTFVRLQVIRGRGAAAIVLGTIVQGYITANQDRAWPGSVLEGSLEGDGYFRSLTGTDPAAGAECAEVVPTGARWQLVAWRVGLLTDATVQNRNVQLRYLNTAAGTVVELVAGGNQPASVSRFHCFVDLGSVGTLASGNFLSTLPAGVVSLAGESIVTTTFGLTAGDNFEAPRYLVREWLEAQ